ncbi:MAG: MFS transporter [Clostridia bacterium]|nr:MFS transporter [Clostridia bacterium]
MAKVSKETLQNFFTEVKTHWKTPAEGKYVPYKEYLNIFFAVGSNYTASKVLEYIYFATGCFLIMHHYKLPYLTFSIISIINMPLGYVTALIWWFVCDNLGFLPGKTEKKLYGVYIGMVIFGLSCIFFDYSTLFDANSKFIIFLNSLEGMSATACFKVFGTHFLYSGWVGARNIFWRKKLIPKFGRYKYSLYSDVIPKCIVVILIGWLPIYEIADVSTRVWAANLLFAIYGVFGFGNVLETTTQSISPNPTERILVRTYPVKLSHFLQTIMTIVIPALVGTLKDEWADINFFRWVIPGVFIFCAALTMICAGSIKERIPQPPLEKKVNIKFWDGMFGVLHNKYRWINTMVGLLDSLGNGMLAFTSILYLYTFRLSGLPYSILTLLISFAGTPPDLLTPYFLKRFSYKQIMIFYQLTRAFGNGALVLAIWFCGDNLILCGSLCVIVMFLMEMTKTVPTSAGHDMNVKINDYQMYLSGERLESFSGIFGWFTGPITSFVGLIIPLLLLSYGFNSNWDILFLDEARLKIVVVPLLIDVVGFFLMTIPYLFWDYDANKQNKVMQVLKRRAEVTERKALEEGEKISGGYTG